MHRRILLAAVTAAVVSSMTVAPSAVAAENTERVPVVAGPAGVDRGGITPRIIGGKPVPDARYAFQAALLIESIGQDDYQRQFCGGSLISPTEVLTAAHCVDFFGDEEGQLPLSDLRVVVGRTVLSSDEGHRSAVRSVAIHPEWEPATFSHDVAVLQLASPARGIRPIALVSPGVDALERPGTRATVTGWGNIIAQPVGPGGGGVEYPDTLQEARVPIVSRAECRTAYASTGAAIDATMLCAGRTNRDTCQGDSGGPLFLKAAGRPGHIQVGITSWGFGCGATGFPGVYTRLSNRSIGNFVLEATGGVPVRIGKSAA